MCDKHWMNKRHQKHQKWVIESRTSEPEIFDKITIDEQVDRLVVDDL